MQYKVRSGRKDPESDWLVKIYDFYFISYLFVDTVWTILQYLLQ